MALVDLSMIAVVGTSGTCVVVVELVTSAVGEGGGKSRMEVVVEDAVVAVSLMRSSMMRCAVGLVRVGRPGRRVGMRLRVSGPTECCRGGGVSR